MGVKKVCVTEVGVKNSVLQRGEWVVGMWDKVTFIHCNRYIYWLNLSKMSPVKSFSKSLVALQWSAFLEMLTVFRFSIAIFIKTTDVLWSALCALESTFIGVDLFVVLKLWGIRLCLTHVSRKEILDSVLFNDLNIRLTLLYF